MTILPVAYLGSVEYFARILAGGCTIDLGEHFVKRSQRNRAHILTANGPMTLSVQLCRANRPRTPVRDVRIDYSKRWQHQHWIALVSAYRASPYFDHYASVLGPFYRRPYPFLADYDLELTATLLRLLGEVPMPVLSERYIEAGPADLDLRDRMRERAAFGVHELGGHRAGDASQASPVDAHGMAGGGAGPAAVEGKRGTEARPATAVGTRPMQTGRGLADGPDREGPAFVAEPYFQLFSDRMPFAANLSVIDLLFAEGPSAGAFLRRCLR